MLSKSSDRPQGTTMDTLTRFQVYTGDSSAPAPSYRFTDMSFKLPARTSKISVLACAKGIM
jgi:hypothetical protein